MTVAWKFLHVKALLTFSDIAMIFLLNVITIQFYFNITTCSGVMTIFVYEKLTRNPKIGNSSVCVLQNISSIRDIKFGADVSNKNLLNTAKFQGFRVYHFCVFIEITTRREK